MNDTESEFEDRGDIFARISSWVAGIAILLIMLGTCADVFLRSVANSGIPGVVEVSEILLTGAVFLGISMAHADGRNVSMSIVTDRMGPRVWRYCAILAALIGLTFALWLSIATGQRAIESVLNGEYRFGLVAVPLWPGRIAVALGSLLLCAQVMRQLYLLLRRPSRTMDSGAAVTKVEF